MSRKSFSFQKMILCILTFDSCKDKIAYQFNELGLFFCLSPKTPNVTRLHSEMISDIAIVIKLVLNLSLFNEGQNLNLRSK